MHYRCLILLLFLTAALGACQTRQTASDLPYTIQDRTMFLRITEAEVIVDLTAVDLDRVDQIKVETRQPQTKLLLRLAGDSPHLWFEDIDAPPSCTIYILAPGGIIFCQNVTVDVGELCLAAAHIGDQDILDLHLENSIGSPILPYGALIDPTTSKD